MAYDRLGGPMGGYPLGEDPAMMGGMGGGYGRQGFGIPGYVDDAYERGRPLGGEFVGGAADMYGAERLPGGYGYGREGYGPSGYGRGYPPEEPLGMPGGVDILEPEPSDLGMGLRDPGLRRGAEYGAGYGRADIGGYGGVSGYGGRPGLGGGYGGGVPGYGRRSELGGGYGPAGYGGMSDLGDGYGDGLSGYGRGGAYGDGRRFRRDDSEQERHRKHEFEGATAAAVGYGLHERHEKNEAEEELENEGGGGKEKKRGKLHRLFHGGGDDD